MNLSKKIEEKKRLKARAIKAQKMKGVTVGVGAGMLAGALGGVLLAPKSGKDTRRDIKEASAKVGEKVGSAVKETTQVLGDKVLVRRNNAKSTKNDTEVVLKGVDTKEEMSEVTDDITVGITE